MGDESCRVRQLEETASTWLGPLSVAIFARCCDGGPPAAGLAESEPTADRAAHEEWMSQQRRGLRSRLQRAGPLEYVVVTIATPTPELCPRFSQHFLDEDGAQLPPAAAAAAAAEYKARRMYPINSLRNLAAAGAHAAADSSNGSMLLLLTDADLVPSVGFASWLTEQSQRYLSSCGHSFADRMIDDKLVLVVPAFEMTDAAMSLSSAPTSLPQTVAQLQRAVVHKLAREFHAEHFPPGHNATLSARWLGMAENVQNRGVGDSSTCAWALDGYDVQYEAGYEPFLIVAVPRDHGINSRASIQTVPQWDDRFTGYGKNKMAYARALHRAGFAFRVLPPGSHFLVARPHSPSVSARQVYFAGHDPALRVRIDALYSAADVHDGCETKFITRRTERQSGMVANPLKS
eukprot:SAG31_NODE_6663_length_1934_cov_1.413079_1_plen_404_part_00